MNLYNSPDPTKAQIVLADVWAQSARREGHRRATPKMPNQVFAKAGKNTKAGTIEAIRAFAKTETGTFTKDQVRIALQRFGNSQIVSALRNALVEGVIVVVGKTAHGLNIYRSAAAVSTENAGENK